jgi:hypothetical protein
VCVLQQRINRVFWWKTSSCSPMNQPSVEVALQDVAADIWLLPQA